MSLESQNVNVDAPTSWGAQINVPFFDPEKNQWAVFEKQLFQFFIANGVINSIRRKAIMLTSMSQNAYTLLENLLSPAQIDANTTTLEACIVAMKTHFKPPSSAFAERFKFYNATKLPTESINEWAVRVRALATACEFGQHLETAIRDKFIMGLEKGP